VDAPIWRKISRPDEIKRSILSPLPFWPLPVVNMGSVSTILTGKARLFSLTLGREKSGMTAARMAAAGAGKISPGMPPVLPAALPCGI
jgi:hypothetical protein